MIAFVGREAVRQTHTIFEAPRVLVFVLVLELESVSNTSWSVCVLISEEDTYYTYSSTNRTVAVILHVIVRSRPLEYFQHFGSFCVFLSLNLFVFFFL